MPSCAQRKSLLKLLDYVNTTYTVVGVDKELKYVYVKREDDGKFFRFLLQRLFAVTVNKAVSENMGARSEWNVRKWQVETDLHELPAISALLKCNIEVRKEEHEVDEPERTVDICSPPTPSSSWESVGDQPKAYEELQARLRLEREERQAESEELRRLHAQAQVALQAERDRVRALEDKLLAILKAEEKKAAAEMGAAEKAAAEAAAAEAAAKAAAEKAAAEKAAAEMAAAEKAAAERAAAEAAAAEAAANAAAEAAAAEKAAAEKVAASEAAAAEKAAAEAAVAEAAAKAVAEAAAAEKAAAEAAAAEVVAKAVAEAAANAAAEKAAAEAAAAEKAPATPTPAQKAKAENPRSLELLAHRKQVSSVLADPDKLKAAQQAVEAMRRQMLSPRSLAVIKLARRMTAAEAPETEAPEASFAEAPAAPMAEEAPATEVPMPGTALTEILPSGWDSKGDLG